MSKLSPPKELRFHGNLSQNWECWKKEFHFYMTATESNLKPEDVKTSRLLTAIGERARGIHYMHNQNEEQNIDDYVTELKLKSSHCEFGTLKESLIRDQIVAGAKDKRVPERLLREPDLTLDKAITIFRAAEESKKQSEEMQAQSLPLETER